MRQKLIFPQFRRLEVQDQGASRAAFFGSLSPGLAFGCTILGVSTSPRKDTSSTGLEPPPPPPPLRPHLTLIASLKAPWPNTDTLGGGACIQKLEVEGQFNPQHPDGVDGHHCPTGRDCCYPLYIIRMWKLRLKVQNAQNGI